MTEWRATHIDGRVGGLGAIPPEIQFDPVTGRLYLHAGAGQARDAFALGGNGLLRFLGAQADGTPAVDLAARGLVLLLEVREAPVADPGHEEVYRMRVLPGPCHGRAKQYAGMKIQSWL